MSKYLHTIEGHPASFDGYQISYANYYGKPNILADSLRQIKKEQLLSVENRKKDGLPNDIRIYGHLRYE